MKASYLWLIFLFGHFSAIGQWSETFSISSFEEYPHWTGDKPLFEINADYQLQSKGPNSTAQISLATENTQWRDIEWSFYAHLDFDITTSNWAKVYLTSTEEDLKASLNGYYVKFDGSSNAVQLYRQDGLVHHKIIAGAAGRAGKLSGNKFKVKVNRNSEGMWSLFSDTTATGNSYFKEGAVFDSTHTRSRFCGVSFSHTSTRSAKFYFDDFEIHRAPLSLLKVEVVDSKTIDLLFNKDVDGNTASILSNYEIQSLGFVDVLVYPDHLKRVRLRLSNVLISDQEYLLTVKNILDVEGEVIGLVNDFVFDFVTPAKYGDLLFSEILPDPSPPNRLPEAEYVELYNRSLDTINIAGYKLSDPSTAAILPFCKIPPKCYVLLCSKNSVVYFSEYRNVIGIENFPSLNNSEDYLELRNTKNDLIHSIHYYDSWYGDNDKKVGGWSLEIIDLNSPCIEKENWTASMDASGGTPGIENSVSETKPDILAPRLESFFIIDQNHVRLSFTENIDTLSGLSNLFQIEGVAISKCYLEKPFLNVVIIECAEAFAFGKVYALALYGVKDCSGNSLFLKDVELVRTEEAVKGDVVINEVLFNPSVGGVDFVELHNASSKYININKWALGNGETTLALVDKPMLMKPKSYLAFTKDKSILLNHYPKGAAEYIIETKIPSYNDDEGTIFLYDSNQVVLEHFPYSEAMHFSLLEDKEGVSLERISASESSLNLQNWHSASTSSGYATPGYKNSNAVSDHKALMVWVEPKVITPNMDGYHDWALIHYQFPFAGFMATLSIYDSEGRKVASLAQNELLSKEGFYKWDGTNDNEVLMCAGMYIVFLEIVNLEGERHHFKESIVVGWGH